jgi:hypothetical protein
MHDLSTIGTMLFFRKFFNEHIFFFRKGNIHTYSFSHDIHKTVIILHIYMPLYVMIYTTCCIILSSKNFREETVKSMVIDREFTSFETEISWKKRKRRQKLDADDFRRARFTRADG